MALNSIVLTKEIYDRIAFRYFSGRSVDGLKDKLREEAGVEPISKELEDQVYVADIYDQGLAQIISEEIIAHFEGYAPYGKIKTNGTVVEWASNQEYQRDAIVTYNGTFYRSIRNDNIGNNPGTETAWWVTFLSDANITNIQTDTTGRTFSTSWADGKTWEPVTLPAKSKIMYHVYIPMRNDSSSWGGGYTEVQYSINGGSYQSMGNSGYETVMEYGQSIHSYINNFFLDFSDITEEFTITFKWRHRSHDGTLDVNGRHDIVTGSSSVNNEQFWSKQIIHQVGGVKGERGNPGVSNPWSSSTTYDDGDVVLYGDKLYVSIQSSNLNNNPSTETSWWQEHSFTNVIWTDTEPSEADMAPNTLYLVY